MGGEREGRQTVEEDARAAGDGRRMVREVALWYLQGESDAGRTRPRSRRSR